MELYELTTIAKVKSKERFALIDSDLEVLRWYQADRCDRQGAWACLVGDENNKWSWFEAHKLILKPLRQPGG
jgi:hypothetical protein